MEELTKIPLVRLEVIIDRKRMKKIKLLSEVCKVNLLGMLVEINAAFEL